MVTLLEEHLRNRCMSSLCPLRLLLSCGRWTLETNLSIHFKSRKCLKSDLNETRLTKETFSGRNSREKRKRKSHSFHVQTFLTCSADSENSEAKHHTKHKALDTAIASQTVNHLFCGFFRFRNDSTLGSCFVSTENPRISQQTLLCKHKRHDGTEHIASDFFLFRSFAESSQNINLSPRASANVSSYRFSHFSFGVFLQFHSRAWVFTTDRRLWSFEL